MRKMPSFTQRYLIFALIVVIKTLTSVDSECSAGHFNLSELAKWNPWTSVANISGNASTFTFNLCDSGLPSCQNASVCWQRNDSAPLNTGSESSDLSQPVLNQNTGGFRLDFVGDSCPEGHDPANQNWTTSVEFKCGTTLGSPEYLTNTSCTFVFEWHTTVACKQDSQPAVSEVPCYIYDANNRKRDLTPLIKQTGGYLVDSEGDRDFYINVCRDITPDGPTSACPADSSGCEVKAGQPGVNMGVAVSRLEPIEDKLRLRYSTSMQPGDCQGYKPTTKISFICPREGGRFGGSKDPVLISDTNCHYIVEWQTEYACEVDLYTSGGDCKFTYDNDGVDIDLAPLRDVETPFYADETTDTGNNNRYYISVCKKLDIEGCGDDPAVCQRNFPGLTTSHSAGKFTGYNLRYTDGEVTLTYSGGATCEHNGFQRTSVITFKCNRTAGMGNPKFVTEVHCMYFFVWETQHVCLEHSRDTTCRVNHGSQRFDLSSLVRERGNNWVALDGQHDHSDAADGGMYYINICANILTDDARTTGCPHGSSACFVAHDGTTKNLGQFKGSPTYEDGEIVLTYVDGEAEGTCTSKTTIRFICTPGETESAPSMVRTLAHSCEYEFEWRTAAACPMGRRQGENCKVFDGEAGFTFDLSPLTKSAADDGYHIMSTEDYKYLINVCDEVHVKGDEVGCNNEPNQHTGACQVEQSGEERKYKLGSASSTLEYYDGILKLSYLNGDSYHTYDGHQANREADLIFMCDMREEGGGRIEFTSEANNTYTFQWYTVYACPQPPVECVVTNPGSHQQYDLSSLSKALDEDNWSYVDSRNPAAKHKYYINVCRPVNPLPYCGPFAAACKTDFEGDQETDGIKNLGVAFSAPTVESEGNLLLRYINGSHCNNGRMIETKLHLRCRKGELASSPRLLEVLDEGCVYSFLWETEAACPITTSTGTGCAVVDQNSGYTFNLRSLFQDPCYEPRKKSADLPTTRINICNEVKNNMCPPIKGKPAGACVQDGTTWTSLGEPSSELTYSDDGLLTLTYLGEVNATTGQHRKAVITFICRHNMSVSTRTPESVSCDGTRECHFNFETPLACLPEPVDCLVSDSAGSQYDLTSLAKDRDNWEAVDTREGKGHLSYHINVCKPLNSLDPAVVGCPGGPIAACQTDSSAGSSSSLGYVQAMPEAADDGTLTIRYVGGSPCDTNTDVQMSTRINFECSDTPGSPVFQTRTDFCEYVFTWQTPAACPLKRSTGNDCRVSVEEFGYEFDLSKLRNTSHNYEVTSNDYKYLLNVCGPITEGPEGCPTGVGGCQETLDGTSAYNAGMANSKLVYDSGVLKLNYTGGLGCHNMVYKRSTAINFVCDDTLTENGHPVYIRETEDCTYQFEWATPLACPPFQQVECSYRGDGVQYDLATLGATGDNYEVSSSKGPEVFYLGVCRSLRNLPGKKGASCPTNAAACMKVPGADGANPSFVNLGQVTTGPTMEGDHLVLRYNSGDPCPSPSSGKKRSTVINFDCDPQAMGSLPEFQYSEVNCTYYFLWMNKLACNIGHEDATGTDCTVANPLTGFQFDLKVLQGIQSVNINSDNHVYNISICKALEDSVCEGKDIGACQAQRDIGSPKHFITGMFNRKVYFDDGVLSLQYERGTPCHDQKFRRSTVISFVCPHEENSLGEPVFISETHDCTYYFSWHTSAACEQYIQCSIMNGTETIDLSPLVQKRGYYIADSEMALLPGTVYINLCRPLNPIQGHLCPPNAAACHVTSSGQPESLGRIENGLQMDAKGQLFIEYTNGATCEQESTRNVSSMIRFVCKRGEEKGVPRLIEYSDCRYTFEWATYVVCPPAPASRGVDCSYRDPVMEYVFDLGPLTHKPYKLSPGSNKEISLQLCGVVDPPLSQCEGAAVCLKDGQRTLSLGKNSMQEFVFEGGNLKVTYTDGSACPDDEHANRMTTIIFMCTNSRISEEPTFFTADADFCHTTLQWDTPIACPPQTMPCTVTSHDGSSVYDLQALSQITGSWTAKDHDQETYFINVCKPALSTPSQCPNDATICRQQPSTVVEVLGMVYTQELEYKDNDRLLLTYTEGRVFTCGDPHTVSRDGYISRVEIDFTCSDVIGKPVFKSKTLEDGVCIFVFTWTSKVACKVERDPVEMTAGKVTDPVTNAELDLGPLLQGGEGGTWLVEGDDRGASTNTMDVYQYYLLLKEGVNMEVPGSSQDCNHAVVCQTKLDDRFFRNIGDQSYKKYFMADGTLELVARHPDSCRKDNSDVLSTVVFECDPEQTPGKPEFLYESGNCQYFFTWQTSHVCQSISEDNGSPGEHSSSPGSTKKGSFGKVFLVLLLVVTLCFLVVLFRKQHRRSAVYARIRRCFPGAYSNVPNYSYVQLSTGENAEGTSDETRGLFDSDGEDEDILKETHPNPLEYKDDSDEDLLADSGV